MQLWIFIMLWLTNNSIKRWCINIFSLSRFHWKTKLFHSKNSIVMLSLNNIQLISIKQNKSRRILFELTDDSTTTCLPYHQKYITFIIIRINVKVLTRFKQNVNIYFMVTFKSFTKIWLIANVNNLPFIKPCGLISIPF